ncbi:MAG: S1 family peptidase, partial [Mucilaginibacter sp.]
MKKYMLFICLLADIFLAVDIGIAQTPAQHEKYIRYDEYYRDIDKMLEPWKQGVHKPLQEILTHAGLLQDDRTLATNVQTLKRATGELNDQDIFSRRKSGVFIFGKLVSLETNGVKSVNFELNGTAFGISADGTCVTNYHVLKSIIHPEKTSNKKDSLYFIITPEKKIYLLESLLAYSRNNDLAVFKVNLRGDKLAAIPLGKPAVVGDPVYCISHPMTHYYYFSKGMVAGNVTIDSLAVTEKYDKIGRAPIRMEITADYGVGSSGGPIMDRHGNI